MVTLPQRVRLANMLYGNDRTGIDTLAPATFYIGLSTAQMGDNGVISGEPTSGGYARVAVANNKNNFSTANNGTGANVFNTDRIEFPEATTAWGNIRTVFFTTSPTSSEALYYISVDKNVQAFTTVYFKGGVNAGDLTLSVSN